ncbi:MAG: hypothetical protein KY469_15210 [Actinobacteria bacterium]|nr:hypothetical protein [Actinomycetota bacterium]
MSIQHQARHHLIEMLVASMDDEAAATLMDYLPPVGWADVATKRDLDTLEAVLRGELNSLRADLRAELHHELGTLRTDVHREIGALRDNLRRLTVTMLFGLVAAVVAVGGIGFATG